MHTSKKLENKMDQTFTKSDSDASSNDFSDLESVSSSPCGSDNFYDGPIQLAPNPNEKYHSKPNETQDKKPLNPQRYWEPEVINRNNQFSLNINTRPKPSNHRIPSEGAYEDRPRSVRPKYEYYQRPRTEYIENRPSRPNDREEKDENFETASELKQKRLQDLEGAEDLVSMKRRIATRFYLTKCDPKMTARGIENYLLRNFDINEVFVRKNAMRFPEYSSFVFIINSEEEIDIEEYEQFDWPGEIMCFFAPRDRNYRH